MTFQSTRLEELTGLVNSNKKAREELAAKGKAFVQDESLPLDLRWNTFLSLKLGDHEGWLVQFEFDKSFPEDFPISHNDYNRGSRIYIEDLDGTLLEMLEPREEPDPPEEEILKILLEEGNDSWEYSDYHVHTPFYDRNNNSKYSKDAIQEDLEPKLLRFTREHYDNWRETVLGMYIKSYDYDW